MTEIRAYVRRRVALVELTAAESEGQAVEDEPVNPRQVTGRLVGWMMVDPLDLEVR